MAIIRIVTTRAPGLIPSLVKEIDHATNPVVLIPESFTLACETEIVNRSRDKGFFDLIFPVLTGQGGSGADRLWQQKAGFGRRSEHDRIPGTPSPPG